MHINRRRFLGVTGAGALGATLSMFGPVPRARAATPPGIKTLHATESTTICPYCGVGCGLICSVIDGKLINIEGDPDHPINEGSLCSKGMALFQIAENERRLAKVQYRAPGSDRWEEKDWDWAIKEIAKRIKATRDATFVPTEDDKVVNRTDGIACLGGAALDNEECYLYSKFARSLGVTWLEHQARI
jgi:anaerobic selenocysteine-containing dehydrogenase